MREDFELYAHFYIHKRDAETIVEDTEHELSKIQGETKKR